jgi:hypothetical protein
MRKEKNIAALQHSAEIGCFERVFELQALSVSRIVL